jgi:hypothetical protein
MAVPAILSEGAVSAAGASGGTAAGSAGGGMAGGTVASSASSGASDFGLIGGSLDAVGFSPMGWVDRATARRTREQEQANLDREFRENMRRWGLDFALREFAARVGITFHLAQQMWNAETTRESLESSDIQQQRARAELEETYRRRKLARAFIKGFGQGMSGGKNA